MILRLAVRTSCCADDSAVCCFVDGCDRAWWAARKSAAKVRRGVGSFAQKKLLETGQEGMRKHTLAAEKIPVYFILDLSSNVRLVIKAEDTVIELRSCHWRV